MACTCQHCNGPYHVDLLIPDEWWERIKPKEKPVGGGLLCPQCILTMIEDRVEYAAFRLSEV